MAHSVIVWVDIDLVLTDIETIWVDMIAVWTDMVIYFSISSSQNVIEMITFHKQKSDTDFSSVPLSQIAYY